MFIFHFHYVELKEIAHDTYGNGREEAQFVSQMGLNTGHNLLKVNIYYQHLNVMKIEESAEYDVMQRKDIS